MLATLVNEDNPFLPVLKRKELDDSDGLILHGIADGNISMKSGRIYEHDNTIENEDIYLMPVGPRGILHQDVAYMWEMYGDRNIFVNSSLPAQIYAKKNPDTFNMDAFEYRKDFSKLASGIIDEYKDYMSQYMMTLPYLKTHLKLNKYTYENKLSSKDAENLFPSHEIGQFKPTIVDKEVLLAVRNPGKYIDILKKKLQLDEDNGYYCYNGIPLICSHELMLAEGRSMKEVLEACSNSKFSCRYCGTDLVIDMEDSTVELNGLQFRLIYLFIQSLDMNLYESFLLNVISEAVQKSIEKLELEINDNYMEQLEAFTATYMYRLYVQLKKSITFDDVTGLITTCNKTWAKAGWDEEIVNTLMDSDERFYGFNHIYKLIVSFKESLKKTESDNVAVQLLLQNMKGKGNPIQQLYLKDKSKLGKLMDILFLEVNNTGQLVDLPKIEKSASKTDIKTVLRELHMKSGLSLRGFFNMWWKELCPVNVVHEFNKDKCKHCGITEKTVNEVYDKYYDKLIELIHPKVNDKVNQKIDYRTAVIKGIESSDTKLPDIPNIDLIIADENMQKLRNKLEELIHIGPIPEIKLSKENNVKLMNYAIKTLKMSAEIIIVEIESTILKPNPLYGKLISVM